MPAPVGRGDLVLDQRVDGGGIGHPQKRLGQAHESDAFVRRQAVFGQEDLHQPGVRPVADRADKIRRAGPDGGAVRARQGGIADQVGDQRRLGAQGQAVEQGGGFGRGWHRVPFPDGP